MIISNDRDPGPLSIFATHPSPSPGEGWRFIASAVVDLILCGEVTSMQWRYATIFAFRVGGRTTFSAWSSEPCEGLAVRREKTVNSCLRYSKTLIFEAASSRSASYLSTDWDAGKILPWLKRLLLQTVFVLVLHECLNFDSICFQSLYIKSQEIYQAEQLEWRWTLAIHVFWKCN